MAYYNKQCIVQCALGRGPKVKNGRINQATISWRASGDRQISLSASAERAFANFRDTKHRIFQLR